VSEQTPDAQVAPAHEAVEGVAPQRRDGTGHPEVDRVLGSLDGLDERPVAEHVAVFEAAHDTLRNALADANNDSSGA
jgi:hypothetical protein